MIDLYGEVRELVRSVNDAISRIRGDLVNRIEEER